VTDWLSKIPHTGNLTASCYSGSTGAAAAPVLAISSRWRAFCRRRWHMRPDEFSDRYGSQNPRTETPAGAPDPNATGSPEHNLHGNSGDPPRETREREAARQRGEIRAQERASGSPPPCDPYLGLARPGVAQHAFAALAENVRDYAIFLIDPDGIITFWGEGARLIKWWTKDEAQGAHLRLLYPDRAAEDGTAEEHLEISAETGEYTGEGHRVRRDGSTFWGGITLTALRDPEGTLVGFAKVTRDLTSQRAAESARKAALDAAEEASRLKSLFLATMSHEIRTPLNAIMAYTDILGMEFGGPLTRTHHEQLGKIRASSQHLLGIINDVLDLSRIEAGRMVAGRVRMRVGTVISQAFALAEPQAEARRVDLTHAVSGKAADHWCWGDEDRVRQILLNLFSNAIKFTEPGGRITISAGMAADPPVDTDLDGTGPWVYVRVEDTGRGIPAERIGAIFEPFVQADMSLTRQHGGGRLDLLPLATCRSG
jgi:PAS domain S-box-containing protein